MPRVATSTSSNGSTSPAISWPSSWPLPRMATTSPGPARSSACRMAERRSPPSTTAVRQTALRGSPRRAPASTSARMAAGVLGARVVVGDHDQIGVPDGGRAHRAALVRVPVAAAAQHHDPAAGPVACSAAATACGVWAKSTKTIGASRPERRPAASDPAPTAPASPAAAAVQVAADRGDHGQRGQRVADVEVAGQSEAELDRPPGDARRRDGAAAVRRPPRTPAPGSPPARTG